MCVKQAKLGINLKPSYLRRGGLTGAHRLEKGWASSWGSYSWLGEA